MKAVLPISAVLVPGERESLGPSAEDRWGLGFQCPLILVIYVVPPAHYRPHSSVTY